MRRIHRFFKKLFGPRKRTYEKHGFYYKTGQILEKLEKYAKLPEGDLSLRNELNGTTYPDFLDVSNYDIYSQTHQKVIGFFRHAKNPIGPNGVWQNRRRKLEEVSPGCLELEAPFTGGGSITIEK